MKEYSQYQKDMFILIGKRVKEERELKGWSIEELSKITKIRKEYIKKIEAGIAYGLIFSKYTKLANAFNVHLADLVKEKYE